MFYQIQYVLYIYDKNDNVMPINCINDDSNLVFIVYLQIISQGKFYTNPGDIVESDVAFELLRKDQVRILLICFYDK